MAGPIQDSPRGANKTNSPLLAFFWTCLSALLHLSLFVPIPVDPTSAEQPSPHEYPLKGYIKEGEINLGAFLSISNYSPFKLCGDKLRFPPSMQYVEALMFAVGEINKDPKLLPNTTLGMIILDDCVKQSTASAQAVRFLPHLHHNIVQPGFSLDMKQDSHNKDYNDNISSNIGKNNSRGRDNGNTVHNNRARSKDCNCHCHFQYDHYDVVGVISPTRSDTSIAVSYLLGPAKIPQLSVSANSDELSNTQLHPYFLRLVPPASQEVTAILEFIARQGWTYISVVTESGSYGDVAVTSIRWEAFRLGICVAVHVKTRLGMAASEYRGLVRELLHYPNARVVLRFIRSTDVSGVLRAVKELDVVGWHVWIGSDVWVDHISMFPANIRPALHGSFITVISQAKVPRFERYFRKLKPSTNENPWFRQFWETSFNCSFQAGTCDESRDITKSEDFHFLSLTGLVIDSVYAYAHSLTKLMEAECRGVLGSELRNCITGSRLLAYLKNVSFLGTTGQVKMGEERASFEISQVLPGRPFTLNTVARVDFTPNNDADGSQSIPGSRATVTDLSPIHWDNWFTSDVPEDVTSENSKDANRLMKDETENRQSDFQNGDFANPISADKNLPWYLDPKASGESLTKFELDLAKTRILMERNQSSNTNISQGRFVESTCSRACKPGEISVPLKTPCCSDCRACRKNEIVTGNGTKCEQCPLFYWPDEASGFKECILIPPHHTKYTDLAVIFEIATSCVGMAVSLAVCAAFIYHRDSKVIKASGRELSSIQLFAIFVGYGTILVYAAPPSDLSCSLAYFLFCLTLDLLYAALLVKAVRIYRIFHAAGKGTRGIRMTSPLSQVIIVCCIVLGQATISTCVTGLHKAQAHLSQPSRSEPYVELSCDMSLAAVSTFLAYNLTLVMLCAVLAFKTRGVPGNFKESRYISMCVTTTLVIWLAFIPTFLTSSLESLKTLLLSLALLLNHSVALVFLFLSKLYTAIYQPDSPGVVMLPVMTNSGRGVVGMIEGATNGNNRSAASTNGATGRFRFKTGRPRRISVEMESKHVAQCAVCPGAFESINAVEGVGEVNKGFTTVQVNPTIPQVRKTGRFTVVTHTGRFVDEASWNPR